MSFCQYHAAVSYTYRKVLVLVLKNAKITKTKGKLKEKLLPFLISSTSTSPSPQSVLPFPVCFLEHCSKAEKLIHAKKSNSILIEMNASTSYHQKYANVPVSSKALGGLARETEEGRVND